MQINTILDISENALIKNNNDLLEILLFDRTTRKNILWGTDDYAYLGEEYSASKELKVELITGKNGKIIQPRILKANEQQEGRTRERAEVFTPAWVCNLQNNLIDDQWFGREHVFNTANAKNWTTSTEKIAFPKGNQKTWKKYVDAKRLEITCGEAPYLVSRYDSVTGRIIPVSERIGMLDRKLRIVNENTVTKEEWLKWAKRAIESVYGYEFQGDSLLLARENILFTYIEYYWNRFSEDPSEKNLKEMALIISWNIWQMDGLNYAIPFCKVSTEPQQMTIFDYMQDLELEDDYFDFGSLKDPKGQALCKIRDWRMKETVIYKNIVGGGAK